jgi:hypothetical protein
MKFTPMKRMIFPSTSTGVPPLKSEETTCTSARSESWLMPLMAMYTSASSCRASLVRRICMPLRSLATVRLVAEAAPCATFTVCPEVIEVVLVPLLPT